MPSPSLRRRRPSVLAVALAAAAIVIASFGPAPSDAATRTDVRILGSAPSSLDPAQQDDAGTAAVTAQLFDCLTAIDSSGHLQPAIAQGWEVLDGGKRVVFHLRPNLTFSDGTPLDAAAVKSSWMRLLAPAANAPFASLLDDVVGAKDYRKGGGSRDGVGIRATGNDLEVSLLRGADLPAVVAAPSLAVVPPSIDTSSGVLSAGSFVGSGGYVLASSSPTDITLTANSRYWAGRPAIRTVHIVIDTGGEDVIGLFRSNDLDYTWVPTYAAPWLAYDKGIGASLRQVTSATVQFYGFETSRPPFSDVHVRRAFRLGIDWRGMVALARGNTSPATSMVPPGIPGRSDVDFGPTFDVAAARAELAQAGYPNGAGFPKVTLITTGSAFDAAVRRQARENLGIDLEYETLDGDTYMARLAKDPPAMWEMGWVADYPGADDFLGLLLGTGKENNWGRWSSPEFDSAIGGALSTADPAAAVQGFDRAQAIVRDDAPVIPVAYSSGFALSAPGLLGAQPNPMGIIRFAGLAWAK